MSTLIDFHCHLDLYPNHAAGFAECDQVGVHTLAVTTTPRAWPHNRDLAAQTQHVRAALGLHPQLVSERAGELALWEEYLPQTRFVGEVGLDAGPLYYHSLDRQKKVFKRILRKCADAGGKILTVHSVRATTAVLDLIAEYLPPSRGRVVLHWFTGSKAEALRAVDLGCYFSVNAEMLRSERNWKILSTIPLDRLLTETDGPFTQHQGRPARPMDVTVALEMLGQARNVDREQLKLTMLENLNRLEC